MAARQDGGNTEKSDASQRAATRLLTKMGVRLELLDRFVVEAHQDDYYVTDIRFKVRYDTVGDVLGIVKSEGPHGKRIAFHSDDTISECLVGMVNRMNNSTLKWKEDIPYGESNSNGKAGPASDGGEDGSPSPA